MKKKTKNSRELTNGELTYKMFAVIVDMIFNTIVILMGGKR